MIRFLLILLAAASAGAQTWNQADSLTNLLTRTPVVGGWYSVKGYRVAGDWGAERTARHVPSSSLSTNFANVFTFGTGRLVFSDSTNTVQDVRWWGVMPDGSTNTTRLQSVIDWGKANLPSLVVEFPGGTVNSGALSYSSNMTFRGQNRRSTTLQLAGAGTLLSPSGTSLVRSFAVEDMRLAGTTNGIGILLDSTEKPRIKDVEIFGFRGDTNSFGLLIQNTYGNAHSGHFTGLNLNSCETALCIRSVNGTYSSGYHVFHGLTIDQETDGIHLLEGDGNGGIYNTFDGVFIQGNGGSGDHVKISGLGNRISGLTIDAIGTGRIWLTSEASGNKVECNHGLSTSAILDEQASGALNNITHMGSMWSPHPSRYWKFGMDSGSGDFRFATATTNGVALKFGNSNGSDLWTLKSGSGSGPDFSLLANGYEFGKWTYNSIGRGNFYPFGGSDDGSNGQRVMVISASTAVPDSAPDSGSAYLYLTSNKLYLRTAAVAATPLGETLPHATAHYAWGNDTLPINELTNTGAIFMEYGNGYGFRYDDGSTVKSLVSDSAQNIYLSALGPNDIYMRADGTNVYRYQTGYGHYWKDRNGTDLATLSASGFSSANGISTKSSTNIGVRIATFGSDPTGSAVALGNMTLADAKNALAIASTDITDSTSAGRALLTAANAAAQRTAIGAIDDAPSDGSQYVRSNATWAVASGGGGGGSPLSVYADIGVGASNVTSITISSGDLIPTHEWQVGGTAGAITLQSFEVAYPLYINGAGLTDGQRYNINDSAPAAPVGYKNLSLATATTNAVVRDKAGYFLSNTLVGTNNSAAEFVVFTNAIPAGWLRDGSRAQLAGLLRSINNTGSNRYLTFRLYVGSGIYTFGDNNPGSASSPRGNHYSADILRSGNTNIFVKVLNAIDNAPGTPSSSASIISTIVSGPNYPTWSQSVSNLDANPLPISLTVAMSVASTNYWFTNVFTHLAPE